MNTKSLIYLFLFSILAAGCRRERNHPVDFYYWKADVHIGETEKNYMIIRIYT